MRRLKKMSKSFNHAGLTGTRAAFQFRYFTIPLNAKMSQPLKRDAEEAFGNDSTNSKDNAASKRRRERRKSSRAAAIGAEPTVHSQKPSKQPSASPKAKKQSPKPNGDSAARSTQNEASKADSPQTVDKSKARRRRDRAKAEREANGVVNSQTNSKADTTGSPSTKVPSEPKEPTVLINGEQPPSPEKVAKDTGKSQRREHNKQKVDKLEKQKKNAKTERSQAISLPVESTPHKKKHKHKQKQKAYTDVDTSKWSLSSPAGGTFIDHDPILTPDEQFLILATTKDIQVYATKTSLLVRTIPAAGNSSIVTFSQLPNKPQHIVVGFENGTIKKFDWTSGQRVWTKKLDNHIVSVTPTSSNDEGDSFLVVLKLEDGQTAITSLTVDYNGEQTGLRPMLSKNTLTGRVCFSAELGIAVVCTQNAILIGRLENDGSNASLLWEEISVLDKIVCFDARITTIQKKGAKSKKAPEYPVVTVATGLKTGEIHIYSDILNKKSDTKSLNPQRLHWHRVAPRTMKFSPDSRYLVSGGDETVLVMWQLDTNQKQVLPHLTSAILNITISSQGSAYALRLADNSVMVLSTSDLKPSANVSGLAIDASSAPFLPDSTVPAALHPQHTSQLLLAYSAQSLTPGLKPSEKSLNMLQTYDTASGLQLSKQALARNLASTINIGGNGQVIHEPDVTHLDVSHDGKWLITVDQWSPEHNDLDQLYLSRGDNSHRGLHNETFLRFWSATIPSSKLKVTSTSSWELNTRIDEPVTLDLSSTSTHPAILAVATSPTRHQVAVADTTNHLKIYSPKARVKGGLPVKDSNGQQLFSWTCDHGLSFQGPSPTESSDSRSASLSFSNDGSVLAVSWATTSDARARVHLVEPKSGSKIVSLPDIVSAGRSHLAFYGQNLVALSSKFVVLDMVTTQRITMFNDIEKEFPGNRFDTGKSRLAVNSRSGIVAVALSERDVKKASHLMLYDVRSLGSGSTVDASPSPVQPIHKERVAETVQILLAERENGGFLIVDGEGRSIRLSPPGSTASSMAMSSTITVPTKLIEDKSRLENIFGSGRKVTGENRVGERGNEGAVVDGMGLDEVFQFERSSDVPGPMELFGRVIGVVAGGSGIVAGA